MYVCILFDTKVCIINCKESSHILWLNPKRREYLTKTNDLKHIIARGWKVIHCSLCEMYTMAFTVIVIYPLIYHIFTG